MLMLGREQFGMNSRPPGWTGPTGYALADELLVARVAAGQGWALSELYQRYARLVFHVAFKRLHERATAEEIVQEVFFKVWRSARDFYPERGRFSSWLIGITQNQCIDELRRRSVRPVFEPMEDELEPGPLTDGDPGVALDQAVDRERVARALARIPPEQRTVVELAYFEGLSHPEIAYRCGDPLGTVKTRLRLGMQKLRGLLEE